ncbi:MAG: hypothetical protein LBU60_04215, partial [Clostridiales bacterium]|nr:hypothetical protein [Clostridiales bacterium]
MKKMKSLSKVLLAAGLVTTGIAGFAMKSTPVNVMASAVLPLEDIAIEQVASDSPEVLKYVFNNDFDRSFNMPFNGLSKGGSISSKFRIGSVKNHEKMSTEDYNEKINELNAKYQHMFKLKSEMDIMDAKHQQYWALQTSYQKELKELTNEWAGTENSFSVVFWADKDESDFDNVKNDKKNDKEKRNIHVKDMDEDKQRPDNQQTDVRKNSAYQHSYNKVDNDIRYHNKNDEYNQGMQNLQGRDDQNITHDRQLNKYRQ